MMILTNPYTGKPVDVSDGSVDRLLAAGFTKAEKKQEAPEVEKPRRGRPRKSE